MPVVTLSDVQMNVVRPNEPVLGRVVKNEICTASRKAAGIVRHIEIDVSATPLAGAFRVGQAFGVIPPGVTPKGKPEKVRLYSIACPSAGEDGAGAVLATTVKRTIDEHWDDHRLFLGVASNYLCDAQIGDEIKVSGPNGKRFLLPIDFNDHDYVFVATGTGIAPYRGMVKELLGAGCTRSITLVMGAPYHTDLLYHDEFESLQASHSNFTYLTAVSRETNADGARGLYVHDRLERDFDRVRTEFEAGGVMLYICGILGMELGIYQTLAGCLGSENLGQFLHVTPEALADPASWTRPMLRKEIKPTSRVLVEVY